MTPTDPTLADLDAVVRRTFADRDFPDVVDPEARVFADLGLASIDLVVLAERLEQHYGRKLPFGGFLKGLRDRGADDFTVGELAAFVRANAGGR